MEIPQSQESYYLNYVSAMKNIHYIASLLIGLLLGACSKDLGNYTYTDVNKISIDSLLLGDHYTERIYTVSFNDTLKLRPIISGSLSKKDTSNLVFEWEINDKIVSTFNKLAYVASDNYGRLNGRLRVYDKTTAIYTTYIFFVDVVNPYKLGYYLLAEAENGDAILYCRSTLKKNARFEQVQIPTLGYLGKEPINLLLSRKYGASFSDYYNRIVLGVNKAKYPVVVLDSREFQPTLLYNQSSYVGGADFIFDPVSLRASPVVDKLVVFATNRNGKIHTLWEGAISQAQVRTDLLDYQAAPNGFVYPYSLMNQIITIYDQKNKKIRLFRLNSTNPNVYFFERSIDDKTKDIDLAKDKEYIFASEAWGIDSTRFVYLMKSKSTLYAYKLGTSNTLEESAFTSIAETTVTNLDKLNFVSYDVMERFWYISIENIIYRASVLGLDLQPYIILPIGEVITRFHISHGQTMVATYDRVKKKSSVYIYTNDDLKLRYVEHGLEKVIDLNIGI